MILEDFPGPFGAGIGEIIVNRVSELVERTRFQE